MISLKPVSQWLVCCNVERGVALVAVVRQRAVTLWALNKAINPTRSGSLCARIGSVAPYWIVRYDPRKQRRRKLHCFIRFTRFLSSSSSSTDSPYRLSVTSFDPLCATYLWFTVAILSSLASCTSDIIAALFLACCMYFLSRSIFLSLRISERVMAGKIRERTR